jgi:hypothetical protein
MVSLTFRNFRMTVLLCYVAASAPSGNISFAMTWQIAKRDAPSATGIRKSSSVAPVKVASLRNTGKYPMGRRPTTRVERPVLTIPNHHLAMLDKLLTVKITLLLLTMLDRHTHNTRPSHSRIINRSTADLAPPLIHCRNTLNPCLNLNLTTPHRKVPRLPSWQRSSQLLR